MVNNTLYTQRCTFRISIIIILFLTIVINILSTNKLLAQNQTSVLIGLYTYHDRSREKQPEPCCPGKYRRPYNTNNHVLAFCADDYVIGRMVNSTHNDSIFALFNVISSETFLGKFGIYSGFVSGYYYNKYQYKGIQPALIPFYYTNYFNRISLYVVAVPLELIGEDGFVNIGFKIELH